MTCLFLPPLRTREHILVEFFAPWCPACVNFLPHLEHIMEQTQVGRNTHNKETSVSNRKNSKKRKKKKNRFRKKIITKVRHKTNIGMEDQI
jgi:thiol-disulfide isomerase/thioredoxin